MDNENEKDRKKWKCKVFVKANELEKSENMCDDCIEKSLFGFYSIYIALSAFSFGMWVYMAGFINLF